MSDADDEYVPAKQIAEGINVSRKTVRRMAQRWNIPTIRKGQVVRYSLRAFVERLAQQSES